MYYDVTLTKLVVLTIRVINTIRDGVRCSVYLTGSQHNTLWQSALFGDVVLYYLNDNVILYYTLRRRLIFQKKKT